MVVEIKRRLLGVFIEECVFYLHGYYYFKKKKSKEKEKSTKDICNVKVFIYHERRPDYV